MSEPLLRVTSLSAGYGDITVVRDVSLDVWPGQVTVMLGRNGAGKTTTLLTIAGLIRAASGAERWNRTCSSVAIRSADDSGSRRWPRRIGGSPSSGSVERRWPAHSVADNNRCWRSPRR